MWKALRDRWSGPITKIGVALTALAFVSKWVGTGRLWFSIAQWLWERIAWLKTDSGRVCLVVVGIGLIWYDQHRRNRPKAHELRTLKGRTLKLRDDLQSFVDGIGTKPKVVRTGDMSNQDFMSATWKEVAPWIDHLTYGYEWLFAARVKEVYLEFGERSLLPGIGLDLPDGLASPDDIKRILDALGKFPAKLDSI
jgi:hypothetical protein